MATSISNGESGLSVRTKLNDIWHSLDLNEYNKEILDTAVDVFVYDTSKDSDGGAWRKRTQATSWYNETLNTATRGSRKEFPSVAVIVADNSAGELVIYDADDPDLPMWIKWTDVSLGGNKPITSVAMLNGILCWGSSDGNASSGALIEYNFLKETRYYFGWYGNTYRLDNAFADRNGDGTNVIDNSRGQILQQNVNDVAMTVLPNAPIDAATGLPVPTIAVATEGGTSVITDSGAVYDSANTQGMIGLAFDSSNDLWWTRNGSAEYTFYAEVSDYTSGDGFGSIKAGSSAGAYSYDMLTRGRGTAYKSDGSYALKGSSAISGTAVVAGLSNYLPNKSNFAATLSNLITSTYNTGWMNGAIKGAFLSDTDDTDVTGSELVTNGTFDSDTSGWTASALTTSVASGQATLTMTSTYGTFVQGITTVVGKTYTITCDIVSETLSGALYLGAGTTSGGSQLGLSTTSVGSNAFTFTATGTTTYVALYFNGASSQAAVIDNFTARLAEEDRSVNGNGLQVFGTVTKNPVSSGADLVGYSGFTTSNYLQQPYNSDLDFGTGDFCVMGWFKHDAQSSRKFLFHRRDLALSGAEIRLRLGSTSVLEAVVTGTSVTSTNTYDDNQWNFFAFYRRSGTLVLDVNGGSDVNSSISTDNLDNSDAVLLIGNFAGLTAEDWDGSLALFRISATVPSPEQIAKIYNDEKVLFQENSQATLYGSSDAVTALAYDDSTELLHVGTSAGRSDFQGLRRVNNTTNAVGAAISASNGMIVEE